MLWYGQEWVCSGELDAVEESCKEVTATCSKLRSRIAMGNAANSEHRARVAVGAGMGDVVVDLLR